MTGQYKCEIKYNGSAKATTPRLLRFPTQLQQQVRATVDARIFGFGDRVWFSWGGCGDAWERAEVRGATGVKKYFKKDC
jgi:hypothetical protein